MQRFKEFSREALPGQRHLRELKRVRHAADPVDLFHQQVFPLDRCPVHFLRRTEDILDQLENVGIGWQREYQHDQTGDPRRNDELILGMAKVLLEVTEEQRLALLAKAQHGVEL
jgi:hypothetical protein